MHFQAQQLLSFLFICTLHWYKHCPGVEVAPNLHKFPLTALCLIAAEGVVYWPVLAGALYAPSHGLHFQAHQLFSFHFTCTLHWSKHCPGVEVAPNLHKFLLMALCIIAEEGVVCWPILVGALLALNNGLHFQVHQHLSFISYAP